MVKPLFKGFGVQMKGNLNLVCI